jgi:hypothetical protein
MLQPMTTSGTKIRTLDTSTPAITGRDEPYSRHDGDYTEDLLTSPSHGLWVTQERRIYAGGCLRSGFPE